jgi:hypothetical protein
VIEIFAYLHEHEKEFREFRESCVRDLLIEVRSQKGLAADYTDKLEKSNIRSWLKVGGWEGGNGVFFTGKKRGK